MEELGFDCPICWMFLFVFVEEVAATFDKGYIRSWVRGEPPRGQAPKHSPCFLCRKPARRTLTTLLARFLTNTASNSKGCLFDQGDGIWADAQIARNLDRDYEATLDFVHEIQEASGDIGEFNLFEVCEDDETYATVGDKGREDKGLSPRSRGFNEGRGEFKRNKPPVLTLVRHSDGRVLFLICKDLEDTDEEIAECGDGSVILCTDGYLIYEDIEEKERVDDHLAVTHSDTHVIGDAHTDTCENRHSFLASSWRNSELFRNIISRGISISLR